MKSIFIMFLLMLLGTATGQTNKQQENFYLSVRILSDDSASLVEQAEGRLIDDAGKVSGLLEEEQLRVRKAGRFTLEIQAPGYFPFSSPVYISGDTLIRVYMKSHMVQQQNFTVRAVQARERSGFVFTNVSAKQLAPVNLGQDFTFLLANTPSAFSTSDAGNGVGYTGLRIRGSDATRINVTVNGIPINDAESHGVFWVNMPDLASSSSGVQIQRGVGSSTVGTGAFGANINIVNTAQQSKPFLQMQQSAGSFGTYKSTLMFGTGLLNDLNFSGRLSKIISSGFIDRATSDLQSFQFNLSLNKEKWNIQAVSFGGKEKTYQAWYGTPESRVNNDVEGMHAFADRNWLSEQERQNLLNSGRTYNYYTYDNQTDNYRQNHYQLHLNAAPGKYLSLRSSFFATTGKGYFEEFKQGASFASYGKADFVSGNDTLSETDLVRRRWLDNLFAGNLSTLTYKRKNTEVLGGAGYTVYTGEHFGEVIWAELAKPFGKDGRYYNSSSRKTEMNTFVKGLFRIKRNIQTDIEMQLRRVAYNSEGTDNDLQAILFDTSYLFFNPKAGVNWQADKTKRFYASYSIGHREPVRGDFIDNSNGIVPTPERMGDLEFGMEYKVRTGLFQVNLYSMDYRNQLVMTGELNDVGSPLRKNVGVSYRRGMELIFARQLHPKITTEGNLNLSTNKILKFEDVYYDYDNNTVVRDVYEKTDIAFSPSGIAYLALNYKPDRSSFVQLNGKYVGAQYLDNTLNSSRMIDPYFLLGLTANKTFLAGSRTPVTAKLMVFNLAGIFYSNNGYTYKYISSGELTTENFYYPQSGRNFMFGLDIKIL